MSDKLLIVLGIVLSGMLGWVLLSQPPVPAPDPLTARIAELYRQGAIPCPHEGVTNNTVSCVWDARARGNGEGRSFLLTDDGEVFYLSN